MVKGIGSKMQMIPVVATMKEGIYITSAVEQANLYGRMETITKVLSKRISNMVSEECIGRLKM